jgi:hypothetical protein
MSNRAASTRFFAINDRSMLCPFHAILRGWASSGGSPFRLRAHGSDNRTGKPYSYIHLETWVRRDQPRQAIRTIVNEALSALKREVAALLQSQS